MKDNPLVTIYRYEGVSHGFNRVGSSAYRKEAAELARDRTLAVVSKSEIGLLSDNSPTAIALATKIF